MGKNSSFKLNQAGVAALLKGAEGVGAALTAAGNRIAAAAGEGHEVETFVGARRMRVTVRTATFAAMEKEATDRNLSRAFDAGR